VKATAGAGSLAAAIALSYSYEVHAQTIADGHLLAAHELRTGLSYAHDSWDEYWEGARKRVNGNIGTVTTRTASCNAAYGLTDKLNLFAIVPYVRTHASQGVLHDMEGFQDLTLAAKLQVLDKPFTATGSLRAFGVVGGAVPLSDYTPDFMPLSLGSASERIFGRLTAHFAATRGWFVTGTTAYTWRDNVRLDRSSYFTQSRLFLTNEVDLPNVFDYALTTGYSNASLMASLSWSEQRTRGGGDIRRQDMPFVSNDMDFSRVSVGLEYALPALPNLRLQLGYAYTLDGRNVGQASTATMGATYRFDFDGGSER
jgi:hypothetical protein